MTRIIGRELQKGRNELVRSLKTYVSGGNKMEWKFVQANIVNFIVNVLYALMALVIGVLAFRFVDKFIFRDINFIEEIKEGNLAAAIYASVILLFIAIILSATLRG